MWKFGKSSKLERQATETTYNIHELQSSLYLCISDKNDYATWLKTIEAAEQICFVRPDLISKDFLKSARDTFHEFLVTVMGEYDGKTEAEAEAEKDAVYRRIIAKGLLDGIEIMDRKLLPSAEEVEAYISDMEEVAYHAEDYSIPVLVDLLDKEARYIKRGTYSAFKWNLRLENIERFIRGVIE